MYVYAYIHIQDFFFFINSYSQQIRPNKSHSNIFLFSTIFSSFTTNLFLCFYILLSKILFFSFFFFLQFLFHLYIYIYVIKYNIRLIINEAQSFIVLLSWLIRRSESQERSKICVCLRIYIYLFTIVILDGQLHIYCTQPDFCLETNVSHENTTSNNQPWTRKVTRKKGDLGTRQSEHTVSNFLKWEASLL